MIELQTERLILKPINIEEAKNVVPLITQNISYWTSLIPWPYSLEDARKWLAKTDWRRLGIYFQGNIIGTIRTPFADDEEIGFWLAEDFQGRGYMFEAIKALIDFAFENLELNFISSSCHTENITSIKLHEKLGFKRLRETTQFWPNKGRDVPVILWRLEKPRV